jgi:hypothetical protein
MLFPAHKLHPYLPQIRGLVPALQTIRFCPNDWNARILAIHWNPLLIAMPQLVSGTITRQQVQQAGALAANGQLSWDSFFLAVMIWGYGTVGYGPWRTEQMFNTQNMAKIFANIRGGISQNRISVAYATAQIDYCGPPFFTKLFYFLGIIFGSNPVPLILDSRVAKSLLKCNGHQFNASNYFRQNGASRCVLGYVDYVTDLNNWSAANNFNPDQLEMFLFCPPVGF